MIVLPDVLAFNLEIVFCGTAVSQASVIEQPTMPGQAMLFGQLYIRPRSCTIRSASSGPPGMTTRTGWLSKERKCW